MAGSYPRPKRDVEFYRRLAHRDLELIDSQRQEISALKRKVNDLEQKLNSKKQFARHK